MGWGQPEAWGNVFVAWGRALIASAFTSERTRQKCEWASRGAGSWRAACFLDRFSPGRRKHYCSILRVGVSTPEAYLTSGLTLDGIADGAAPTGARIPLPAGALQPQPRRSGAF